MASAILSSVISIVAKVTGLNDAAGCSLSSSSSSSSAAAEEVQGDMRHLRRTLLRIEAVLGDAEEREIKDQSVNLWLQELRALAVQSEDVLDEYHYELLHQQASQEMSTGKSDILSDDSSILESMARKIKSIRRMFEEIERERDALQLRESDGERKDDASWKPVPTSSFLGDSRIYGRRNDREKIVKFLLNGRLGDKTEIVETMRDDRPDFRSISVLPIVGIGGLGKTTLAQLAYNDNSVQEFFDFRVWICVSDNFDVVRITKQIVESCTDHPCDTTELDQLQKILARLLKKKKILVVLDDLSNERPVLWESLRAPFSYANLTKVLATTRSELVASIIQTRSPYRLNHLSESDCLAIFTQFATRPLYRQQPFKQSNHQKFGSIARQIAVKCKGMPLVAKTLGSLLCNEIDEDRWREVAESELWELEDQGNNILPVLKLSYYRMPGYLKICFAYLGLFPKSCIFQKDYVVKLWLAQGYIVPKGKRSLEDIAGSYFEELIQRSMLQFSRFSKSTKEGFLMHDLIHDLAVHVAVNQCLSVVDSKTVDIGTDVLHASYVPSRDQVILDFHALCRATNLRTLLVPMSRQMQGCVYDIPEVNRKPGPHRKGKHISSMKYEYTGSCEIDNSMIKYNISNGYETSDSTIQNLQCYSSSSSSGYEDSMIEWSKQFREMQLRYKEDFMIELSKRFPELPRYYNISSRDDNSDSTIQNLQCYNSSGYDNSDSTIQNLQCYNSSGYEIPESMIEMFKRLRVLDLSYTGLLRAPNLIGELKHLRYLALRETTITDLPESLCKLYNLQVLDLDRCESLRKLPRGMQNLTELRDLKLPVLEDCHICMPRGIGKLTNLQTLSAFYTGGDVHHCGIDELNGLVNLKGKLKIYGLNRVQEQIFVDLGRLRSIRKMMLCWDVGGSDKCDYGGIEEGQSMYIDAASVLSGVVPQINIEELIVEAFCGSRLPNWIGNCSYQSISSIRLNFCNDSCTELPPLGRLPTLKHLSVQGMVALKTIGPEFCGCTSRVTMCFPRLEMLECSDMLSWEEWYNLHDDSFPRLNELTISCCARLLRLPISLSSSLCTLELQDCDSLSLLPVLPSLTLLILRGRCHFYLWSRSLCLPKLECLQISYYSWQTLEFFKNLSMVRTIRLENCPNIEELIGLRHLKSLQVLEARACPNLKLSQEDSQQSNFVVCFAP